jgi:uncharacterized protein YecE (DUF72 family)
MPAAASAAARGTHLERYAQMFAGVEINSSFHRSHRRATYARWAASVGDGFRFSVKIPKTITHERKLADVEDLLTPFFDEVSGLGEKLGCLLVQLPPKRGRLAGVDEAFFETLRSRTSVDIVCEPRNTEWFNGETDAMLAGFSVARVIADPPADLREIEPVGIPPVTYLRMHGCPRIYYSEYDQEALDRLRDLLISRHEAGHRCWCVFDNTAAGHAVVNAMQLVDRLREV